jgi:hypothetical protein
VAVLSLVAGFSRSVDVVPKKYTEACQKEIEAFRKFLREIWWMPSICI